MLFKGVTKILTCFLGVLLAMILKVTIHKKAPKKFNFSLIEKIPTWSYCDKIDS